MMRKQPSPRCSFLQQINEVSFAVNDMLLYLDTHPEDQKALRYFSDISDRRNQLMAEYAEKYGPLTIDNAAVSLSLIHISLERVNLRSFLFVSFQNFLQVSLLNKSNSGNTSSLPASISKIMTALEI